MAVLNLIKTYLFSCTPLKYVQWFNGPNKMNFD